MLASLYFLFFAGLAWRNFRLAIGLFIVFLPTYLIRFEIFGLPSTLLELSFGAVFLVWLLKFAKNDFINIKNFVLENKVFSILFGLFFLSSIGGIFVSDEWLRSTGQWRAFFFEPILFFVMMIGRFLPFSKGEVEGVAKNRQTTPNPSPYQFATGRALERKGNYLVLFLGLSTVSISLLAILQKFFPKLYPMKLWNEEVFGRVTSFFTTPNAIGLYLVPILILLAGYLYKSYKINKLKTPASRILLSASVLALCAIGLSISEGAWIALAVGFVAFIYLIGYKKITYVAILIAIIIVTLVTPLRQSILFQDQSGQNRLTIWSYTSDYLTESPQNFILGNGIRQWFRKIQKPYYFDSDNNLERLTFPHNIFLNFWTEIGLLGMLSFVGIMYFIFRWSYKVYKNDKIIGAGFIAMWIAFLVHGLVDVPYFKNDLAFLFWILVVLTFLKASSCSPLSQGGVRGGCQ